MKNCSVDPEFKAPYLMVGWLTKSSAESMGVTILSTVKKAARLAVYEEMLIKTKNHQAPPIIRPEMDLWT